MADKGTLLYGSMDKADAGGAAEFITRLMHGATAIHMHHLMATGPGSYAAHTALGMYGELADLADGLAESWMGCTGGSLSFKGGSFELASSGLEEITKLYEFVEDRRMMMGPESHIQNDIDAVCTLLASTKYKLEKLA